MLIRLLLVAIAMCCAFDAFGAEQPVYTSDISLVCHDERPLYYLDKLIKQGDKEAVSQLIGIVISKETCVIAKSGLPVYIMATDGIVATIRLQGSVIPMYTIERSLMRSKKESKNSAPGKSLGTPELRNF